jgi:hypothetical protein
MKSVKAGFTGDTAPPAAKRGGTNNNMPAIRFNIMMGNRFDVNRCIVSPSKLFEINTMALSDEKQDSFLFQFVRNDIEKQSENRY